VHTTSVSSAACYDAYGSVFWLPGQRVHASLSVQLPTGQHTVVCKLVAVWRDATRCCEVFLHRNSVFGTHVCGKDFRKTRVKNHKHAHFSSMCLQCVANAGCTLEQHYRNARIGDSSAATPGPITEPAQRSIRVFITHQTHTHGASPEPVRFWGPLDSGPPPPLYRSCKSHPKVQRRSLSNAWALPRATDAPRRMNKL
jgi:hypothetical protein